MDNANFLPNDLTECHQLLLAAHKQSVELEQQVSEATQHVAESEQRVAELGRVLDETAASYQELQQTHAATLDELAWYKRWTFGRRRERFTEGAGQGHLFDLDSPATEPEDSTTPDQEAEAEVKPHRRRRKKREIDWDKLPQIHDEHDLSEAEKNCSCCGRQMDRIGEDVTRELELEPAKLEAHIHTRPKYACRRCKEGVRAAPLPQRPIPGGIAGPGLVTEVIVGKLGDHIPLYRLEATEAADRSGRSKAEGCSRKRDQQHPYSVYDFTNNRSRAGPASFLENYSGFLHADAYTGYDAMFVDVGPGVVEVACWAHARRKFFDAVKSSPRESHQMLEWIRQLYDLEDRACEWSVEARREIRTRESHPVLDKMEAYLAELARRVLPKSSLAKAVTYARNQWKALCRYTGDGRLTIDNNVSERTLRHQAIGRKNWLFLGSEAAGPRAAVLSTILAGAKRHRIEPWCYVRDLLLRLHADDLRLEEMLPDRWAAAHPEAILTHRLEESRAKAIRTRARRAHRRARSK